MNPLFQTESFGLTFFKLFPYYKYLTFPQTFSIQLFNQKATNLLITVCLAKKFDFREIIYTSFPKIIGKELKHC